MKPILGGLREPLHTLTAKLEKSRVIRVNFNARHESANPEEQPMSDTGNAATPLINLCIPVLYHMGRKSRVSDVAVMLIIIVIGVVIISKYTGILEAFECWCRDSHSDGSTSGGLTMTTLTMGHLDVQQNLSHHKILFIGKYANMQITLGGMMCGTMSHTTTPRESPKRLNEPVSL